MKKIFHKNIINEIKINNLLSFFYIIFQYQKSFFRIYPMIKFQVQKFGLIHFLLIEFMGLKFFMLVAQIY